MYEATNESYKTFDVVGEAIAGTLSWFSIIVLIASIIFLIIALIRKKQLVQEVKRPFLRPLVVFGVSVASFVLLIIIGMVYALEHYANKEQTASHLKSDTIYQETDDKSKEIDKLKGDISLLETQNKTLDAEVKKLKEELAKKEQQAPQEQPKKEDVKPEPQQPAAQPEKKDEPKQQSTGSFVNPVKDINKTEAINRVKEKAKQDFKDDYTTQNYVANEQTKAFDFLYGIEIKSQEELNIMKNALKDFPNDFMTAKFVYEEQMKAKNQQ